MLRPTVRTELVLASDGLIYVNAAERNPGTLDEERLFVGYALTRAEARAIGPRGLLLFGLLMRIALGSDGRVYVDRESLEPRHYADRMVFRGVVLSQAETELAVDAIHRQALNVTIETRSARRRAR